ncbi:MAG TPA: aminotransferase class IV [Polyangiaceae bacterium]
MNRLAMIDGVVHPLEHASVSVLDRGFLYGDSVFETIRTYDGVPHALGEHLERLERSAGLVHIELPVPRAVFAQEIAESVRAAGNEESYIRAMVTRGSGELGLDPSLAGKGLRVILVTPLAAPPASLYESGIHVITHVTRRAADATPAAGAKIGNYLVSVLAIREAKARGAAEALIVDGEGRIVEGATSNVFFVRGGTLLTPPEGLGILPGITRGAVLAVAARLGMAVDFRAPSVAEAAAFDEVFITSSIRELLAVVQLDGAPVSGGIPGPVYRRLLTAFRASVRPVPG